MDSSQTSPICQITITIRVIKSFEYRTSKNIILKIDPSLTTVGELKDICQKHIDEESKFKPFRMVKYDTLKIYTQAFGHKSQDLIINKEDKEFLNNENDMLDFVGVKNETELSFFNRDAYDQYVEDPKIL
ncbi:hypothetical protein GGI25_006026, partial [Coemansia spiralis]